MTPEGKVRSPKGTGSVYVRDGVVIGQYEVRTPEGEIRSMSDGVGHCPSCGPEVLFVKASGLLRPDAPFLRYSTALNSRQ